MRIAAQLCSGIALIVLLVGSAKQACAQIVTDGSVGVATSLAGPAYAIGPELGVTVGNNLFHSFSAFNLAQGESATFTGASSLANIIARVTGGNASTIDGVITTQTGGTPNLFLLNPSGLVFGPNASLDLEGSFHATTADYLRFSDGTKFFADLGGGSSVTSAVPAAFGFLNANPAGLAVSGAQITVTPGATLNLVAGEVSVDAAGIAAPGGSVAVTSVAAAGEVPVDSSDTEVLTVTKLGATSVTGGSVFDVSNDSAAVAGGSLVIRAGTLSVDGSTMTADNHGPGPGGKISLTGTDSLSITSGSVITSTAADLGSGATIRLSGGVVILDQASEVATDSTSLGPGGAIDVTADSLEVLNGAAIATFAENAGQAGPLTVTVVGALEIDGDPASNFLSGLLSDTYGSNGGDAGAITVSADTITLTGSGQISSASFGGGGGRDVTVSATTAIEIDGDPTALEDTGILSATYAADGGNAGHVTVISGRILITETGKIASTTQGAGLGGEVDVAASGGIEIDGDPTVGFSTGIASVSSGATGGLISVRADSLAITATGAIESNTIGGANGGDIVIAVTGAVEITGDPMASNATGILAGTGGASGDAGRVSVTAGDIAISATGEISSKTVGTGNGGAVDVTATRTIRIIGDPQTTSPTGIFANTLASATGDAGRVAVSAGNFIIASGGEISSSTFGHGRGGRVAVTASGDIEIDGDSSALGPSGIFANSDITAWGDAGQITVTASNLLITGIGEIASNTFSAGKGGSVSVIIGGKIEVIGDPASNAVTGIVADTESMATGNAGSVTVAAGSVVLRGTGEISSGTFGSGAGGAVSVTASGAVTIAGDATADSQTGIFAVSGANASGDAGALSVKAGSISLTETGRISSNTSGAGRGGIVVVTAEGAVAISGTSLGTTTAGIFADSTAGATGDAGALLSVDAESISLTNFGQISSSTKGPGHGGGVQVAAGTITISNAGQISSNTFGAGSGGAVNITARGTLSLSGALGVLEPTGIIADAGSAATGSAGAVTISAGNIAIAGSGAEISSSTFGEGVGGSVRVTATGSVAITGDPRTNLVTGITTDSNSTAFGAGAAGHVTVIAGELDLRQAGEIASTTFGPGAGGRIDVTVSGIVTIISGNALESATGIVADSASTAAAGTAAAGGAAESIYLVAHRVVMSGGAAEISSSTFGAGAGGDVQIAADDLSEAAGALVSSASAGAGNAGTITVTLSGSFSADGTASGLLSSALANGNAGDIVLTADRVRVSNRGSIATTVAAAGDGGAIKITARETVIDGGRIDAASSGSGKSGTIDIDPSTILIENHGIISALANGTGASGTVRLVADTVSIRDSSVTTTSTQGGGGEIAIRTTGLFSLSHGLVTTTVHGGTQTAGNIDASSGLLVLESSILSANADQGRGGNLVVTVNGLVQTPDSAITASSNAGLNGTIAVSTLGSDVTAGLAELSGKLATSGNLSHLACGGPGQGGTAHSSLLVRGRGALPFDADAPATAFYGDTAALGVPPVAAIAPAAFQPCSL